MRILWTFHDAGHPGIGGNQRAHALSRHWVRMGHEVTVAAAAFSHNRSRQPHCGEGLSGEEVDGVRFVWIPTREFRGNGVRRALNMFDFARGIRRLNSFSNEKYDVVICASVHGLDIYPCRSLQLKWNSALIREIRDIWPLTLLEIGNLSRYHPFLLLLKNAESKALGSSDLIVSNLPAYGKYLGTTAYADRQWLHIPNGIDPDWPICAQGCSHCQAYRHELQAMQERGKFIVLYAGAHGPANHLDALVESGRYLSSSEVEIVFVGDGPSKSLLQERASQLALQNLTFIDRVPPGCARGLMGLADLLIVVLNPTKLLDFGVSLNKLFDYMLAGKPIAWCGHAANDPVSEAGCGITTDSDPAAIAKAVMRLVKLTPTERAAMGARGRQYVLEHHAYPELARRYLDALERAVRSRRSEHSEASPAAVAP